MTSEALPVSVVIPTIGRPASLQSCLESLSRCDPGAEEIVIVDQSGDRAVAEVVARFGASRARLVACSGRGRPRAVNAGLREAACDVAMITDDDCTVSSSWIATGWRHLAGRGRERVITGKVSPCGDPRAVPSTVEDPSPRDYTSSFDCGMLYAGNMACNPRAVLALGGFDERIRPAAEDVDFAYRWLRAGNLLRYDPELIVWHHDWRSSAELERLYVGYAHGVGVFCAKHLRQGDARVLLFVVRELYGGVRGIAARFVGGRPRWSDSRQGALVGLPAGLREGWRTFRSAAEPSRG
ncbi:MAG: glycosyltransferase family 2 protein [Propionibacteriales bacterium]|nr:glycosyltransferase family 2 protein [Propionibacteriales bacterium]